MSMDKRIEAKNLVQYGCHSEAEQLRGTPQRLCNKETKQERHVLPNEKACEGCKHQDD